MNAPIRLTRLLFAATLALAALGSQAAQLTYKVYTGSPAGFNVTSTLIEGEKDAILVDAQFTLSDAHRLAAMILESKKNLTTVYVTHAHPDHYWGLNVIKQTFPKARIVALPATIADIKELQPKKIKQWKPVYGANVPDQPIIPAPLQGTALALEGEKIELIGGVQGDTEHNSIVWIPSIKLAIAGDIVYNNTHVWMLETPKAEQRAAWIVTLNRIEAMQPAAVVAGHKSEGAPDTPQAVAHTRAYVQAFDKLVADGAKADEIKTQINTRFPDLKTLAIALDLASKGLGKQ